MIKSTFLPSVLLCVVFCFFDACQGSRLEKNLDPESSDFLAMVRYIITTEEYDRFLKLPAGERSKFIEDFWKLRDPDPDTEENEFKELYLARLNEAAQLFGKGAAGFLTDQGMIYVLLGPPDYVYRSPMFRTMGEKIHEMWLYSLLFDKHYDVRIYFVDRFGSGRFELVRGAYIFSLIQEAKSNYLAMAANNKPFQYVIHLKVLEKKGDNVKLSIRIEVPYKNIWFSKVEDKMEATLSLHMKILDASKNEIWRHEQDYSLSIVEKKVEELLKVSEKHVIEIPAVLPAGEYSLHVNLTDKGGGEEEKKVLPIKI